MWFRLILDNTPVQELIESTKECTINFNTSPVTLEDTFADRQIFKCTCCKRWMRGAMNSSTTCAALDAYNGCHTKPEYKEMQLKKSKIIILK